MKSSTMASRSGVFAAACLALFFCVGAQAAQVRAWLDRSSMQLGETVTLNVEVSDDAGAAQPDFGVLQADFNLLGTQSSTSMNIVNGNATSKLLWAVGLEPKRAGTFTIPAFTVAGAQTQPLSLTVKPGGTTTGKAGDEVFLDVTIEPKTPYVQQQVRVTLKLFYAVNLTDGNLEDPHGDGLSARKVGQDASYSSDIDGRRYRVLERHYSVVAEKSGAATIAPIVFRGHAVNPNDINSFFNRGHLVSAQAAGETLDVRPRPASSGTDAWLPAQSLSLTADGIDAATPGRVGEPLTLTLHLKAQGLGYEQLPEVKLPKIDGAEIYPDKEATQNRDDGTWIFGERSRKFAIVPNRPGKLTLPPISVSWWDTDHDRAATADLSAVVLDIQPAIAMGASPPPVPAASTASTSTTSAASGTQRIEPNQAQAGDGESRPWRMTALISIGLWIVTMLGVLAGWLRRARVPGGSAANSAPSPDEVTVRAARNAFADACRNDDSRAIGHALLAWARAEGGAVRTLGELGGVLTDAAQRQALLDLERSRFGSSEKNIAGERIAAAFRKGLSLAVNAVPRTPSALPPLYPFSVGEKQERRTLG